ncbi:MAG: AsmA family protein [Rhodobacteraceae bacterium]|jgi:AsmA protein|nr:AsmA family protein [Paracoccaceae bacterium]
MRWILRIVVVLVALVAVVAGGVALIPAERIAAMATAQFQRLTGRELRIEGGVSPRFWPVLGVATGPVSIANAEWSDEDGPMFAADRLVIEINASALLGGDIRILGLSAERPRILLERAKNGQENWVFGGGGEGDSAGEVSAATPGVGRAYTLEKGAIRGGTIRFVDHAAGRDVTLDDVDLDLAIPDFSGPFTLKASAVTAGQKAGIVAEIGVFSAFTEGRVVPVTLSATAGGSRLAFDGRAGWQPLVAEGTLEADLADLAAVSALAGTAAPELPQGFGRDRLAVTGSFTLDEAGVAYLRGAMIEADGNRLSGDLDLAPGKDRPKLSASLRSPALAFSTGTAAPAASGGGGGSAPVAETGWPKAEIDVSGLGAMDAAVALVAGSVDLGGLKLGETRMVVTLDRARAVFDLAKVTAYGGEIAGQFVANGRGGLSVGGDLMFANLQMQDLLSDLIGWDRLIGQGNLNVKFLGIGNSVDAIMKSLKGEGRLALGKGEVRGLDVAGMLRTLDTSYVGEGQKTIFDGVSGSFSMADGVLSNGDLKLQAPYLVATGAGTVGLGARNLDYSIRPVAFPGEDGTGGVMVPLRITGAWADPTFHLDLESIAREKMEAEAKATEARAKAELEKKLQEELGIERADGESLEDAAKRRAQEALEKEAGKLLEGLLGGN